MDIMSDGFHEIALKSILFKGRSDLYFCYLKSEKIAHVLAILAQQASYKDSSTFEELLSLSSRLPHSLLHFVAGEIGAEILIADLLSLISLVRMSVTEGLVHKENGLVLCQEYETITRKIAAENHPSPFISSKDFAVEEIKLTPPPKALFSEPYGVLREKRAEPDLIKDTSKGHTERTSLILDIVRKNKGISIKDIAAVVRGCSEKTIQRELTTLIDKGLIERRGERRWSVYIALS